MVNNFEVSLHQDNRRKFWTDIICASLSAQRSVFSVEHLTNVADYYLQEYDKRFNPQTGTKVVPQEKSN